MALTHQEAGKLFILKWKLRLKMSLAELPALVSRVIPPPVSTLPLIQRYSHSYQRSHADSLLYLCVDQHLLNQTFFSSVKCFLMDSRRISPWSSPCCWRRKVWMITFTFSRYQTSKVILRCAHFHLNLFCGLVIFRQYLYLRPLHLWPKCTVLSSVSLFILTFCLFKADECYFLC